MRFLICTHVGYYVKCPKENVLCADIGDVVSLVGLWFSAKYNILF